MIVLAVDPGVTGAVAGVTDTGAFAFVFDLPAARDGKLAWIDGAELFGQLAKAEGVFGPVHRAYVERQQAMPGNGSATNITIGATLGSILAVLNVRRVGVALVPPGQWKRELGLVGPKGETQTERKARSLQRARMLFPTADLDRAKDHNRAEALLLASWGAHKLRLTSAA